MGSINRAVANASLSGCLCIAVLMIASNCYAADPAMVVRGAYLARVGDCVGCHTAGPRHPPFAGGLPLNSPFGIIYSTNITPDPVTGIGQYSYSDFSRAVREGVAKDGRQLYPAMPYPSFAATSDEDVQALYAYFMNDVEAVRHKPPQTRLPFPFNQRWVFRLWDAAFVNQARYKPRLDRDAQWNRGAYLVQSLGHCGACHTPRGLAYQEKAYSELSPEYLSGAVIDNWFAANLNGNRASGLGRWSEAEIATFLKTGHRGHGHAVAFGSMVTVVEKSTQYLRTEDLNAIAHYLKSLPARKVKTSYKPYKPRATRDHIVLTGAVAGPFERPGGGLYEGFCDKCHQDGGTGKPPKIPQLAGSAMVLSVNTTSLIRLVLEGGKGPVTKSGPEPKEMPSYAKKFTDREIADVLTFIRNSWGNRAPPVTPRDVALLRRELQK